MFKHDSWDKFYKDPFGAVPTGTDVHYRVKADTATDIMLHIVFGDKEFYYPMEQAVDDPSIYELTVPAPDTPGIIWYDFHFNDFDKHYVYGTDYDTFGGEGQVNLYHHNPYQITVYDPERKVPSWYKEGVMYQIFPDRFAFGERDDFKPEYREKSLLHPNWKDIPHYFKDELGRIEYYDFFGGNLQGIIEKLDYLKDLGISIIYLNPIFEALSNHKYDTADYMKIDPAFGNEEIFTELCEEAKKRGIRIILDGVFNHTGDDSKYFNKYGHFDSLGAYQSNRSKYYHWYNFVDYPDDYLGWWGIKTMPSMDKHNPEYQAFIYGNRDSVVRHWLRAGASGWRLDVADELTDQFIVGIKDAMLKVKPDSVLIGEVWEDASNKISYGERREYFLGHELDSVMNYPFRNAVIDFFLNNKNANEVMRDLMSLYEHYPKENFFSNMNLIGSHDRERILTVLGEPEKNEPVQDKENYKLNQTDREKAKERLKQMVLLQMTFPGIPVVYYGDEVGMEGFADPLNRGPYPWDDGDQELKRWYKKLIHLRNQNEILKKGCFWPVWGDPDVFSFTRKYKGQTILVAINRNPDEAKYVFYNHPGNFGIDLLTQKKIELGEIELPPRSAIVLELSDHLQ